MDTTEYLRWSAELYFQGVESSETPEMLHDLGGALSLAGHDLEEIRVENFRTARGLVLRRVEPGPPVRVTYELTESGRSFGEVAEAIERWGRGLKPAAKRRSVRTA